MLSKLSSGVFQIYEQKLMVQPSYSRKTAFEISFINFNPHLDYVLSVVIIISFLKER